MKRRTRIKICGITRLQDALHAAEQGVDSLGFVFHQQSPRTIDIGLAREIRQSLPPFVTTTALLMNENEDWTARVVHQFQPDCLQFHGSETLQFCESWGLPYMKALAMGSIADPRAYAENYSTAQGFLFDSNAAGRQGGSGDTFDWSKIPPDFDFPLVLAGGINVSNVADAIQQVAPWGVDISSGVEVAKGIKDPHLIDRFVDEVYRADLNRNPERQK